MTQNLKLVTAGEAAARLNVHHKTIARLMRLGKLPAAKIANRWLMEEGVFNTFCESYGGKKGRPKGWSPKRR